MNNQDQNNSMEKINNKTEEQQKAKTEVNGIMGLDYNKLLGIAELGLGLDDPTGEWSKPIGSGPLKPFSCRNIYVNSEYICPDCKNTKQILLLTSTVECEKCKKQNIKTNTTTALINEGNKNLKERQEILDCKTKNDIKGERTKQLINTLKESGALEKAGEVLLKRLFPNEKEKQSQENISDYKTWADKTNEERIGPRLKQQEIKPEQTIPQLQQSKSLENATKEGLRKELLLIKARQKKFQEDNKQKCNSITTSAAITSINYDQIIGIIGKGIGLEASQLSEWSAPLAAIGASALASFSSRMGDYQSCKDCKGTGKITLLNSVVTCDCCKRIKKIMDDNKKE